MEKSKTNGQLDSKIGSTSSKHCIYFYGIDVSMETLAVAQLLEDGTYIVKEYANTEEGIAQLMAAIESNGVSNLTLVTPDSYRDEATGTYSMKVVFRLSEAQIPVAMLNPKQSSGFINGVLLSTTKTDEKDACGLALYGKFNRPPVYQLPPDKVLEIKELRNYLFTLKKHERTYENQLHSASYRERRNMEVKRRIEKRLADTKEEIKEIEQMLCNLSKEAFDKLYKLALSIKGIGPSTAALLLMVTNGCEGFHNVKQLAKFLGICPTQKQSGKSLKKRGGISKTGTRQVRANLYMCALSAIDCNTTCKDLYQRLRRRGKGHNVAMMAVAHKLVKQFFAVIKSGVPYDDEYHLRDLKDRKAKQQQTERKAA